MNYDDRIKQTNALVGIAIYTIISFFILTIIFALCAKDYNGIQVINKETKKIIHTNSINCKDAMQKDVLFHNPQINNLIFNYKTAHTPPKTVIKDLNGNIHFTGPQIHNNDTLTAVLSNLREKKEIGKGWEYKSFISKTIIKGKYDKKTIRVVNKKVNKAQFEEIKMQLKTVKDLNDLTMEYIYTTQIINLDTNEILINKIGKKLSLKDLKSEIETLKKNGQISDGYIKEEIPEQYVYIILNEKNEEIRRENKKIKAKDWDNIYHAERLKLVPWENYTIEPIHIEKRFNWWSYIVWLYITILGGILFAIFCFRLINSQIEPEKYNQEKNENENLFIATKNKWVFTLDFLSNANTYKKAIISVVVIFLIWVVTQLLVIITKGTISTLISLKPLWYISSIAIFGLTGAFLYAKYDLNKRSIEAQKEVMKHETEIKLLGAPVQETVLIEDKSPKNKNEEKK